MFTKSPRQNAPSESWVFSHFRKHIAVQIKVHIFGALAEFERGLIIERTREDMKAARARGVKSGPPPKLDRQQSDHARQLIDKEGKRREDVADLFKVSRSTLYRALVVDQ